MRARLSWFLLLILVITPAVHAKAKKPPLPEQVLRARTVVVLIAPDAGEPVDQPNANINARDNVEKALNEWGRLHPLMEGQTVDLVIAVRAGTGRSGGPKIKGGPIDDRTTVGQSTDSTIRLGGQIGHPPPLSDPSLSGTRTQGQPDQGPHVTNEIGPAEDMIEVYLGGTEYPLDSPPIWRYIAKGCLRPPNVSAVEQFRKLIAESEQLQQKKP